MKAGFLSFCAIAIASVAVAQGVETAIAPTPITDAPLVLSEAEAAQQEACLTTIAGFPSENTTARYQFFKLTEMMAMDADPDFRAALAHFGDGNVPPETPLLEVLDGIANPVMRQAMPSLTVAQSAYLIDFAVDCRSYVNGQMNSLVAFDESLSHAEFNEIISEDALFLRQILSDALYRLGAASDEVYGPAVTANSASLVHMRDTIEYASFDTSVGELEALYMDDLDGRLAKANDMINGEMDREITGATVAMADEMSEAIREENRRQMLRTLYGILNSY